MRARRTRVSKVIACPVGQEFEIELVVPVSSRLRGRMNRVRACRLDDAVRLPDIRLTWIVVAAILAPWIVAEG